ncbi:MAG: FHA domain-containing protein [Polyangiaceae bacterium]|nr:FHA domain-containing protein [Polyangiaceae bacterium]
MSDEEATGPHALGRNEPTRVLSLSDLGRSRQAPLGPRAAFLVAHERLTVLASAATEPAVALVAVDAQARVFGSRLLRARGALVVGRHSQCGLCLGRETISLRHVAFLVQGSGQQLRIHARDLATGAPFVTEDGHPNSAVVAEGPLYVAIEGYALWLVPVGPSLGIAPRADDAYAALPPRAFVDRRPPSLGAAPEPPAPHRVGERRAGSTSITSLGPPLLLGDGDEPEVGWGVLRIDDGKHKERRSVSAERLERGILLGRYARCGLVLSSPTNTISRVHALLLRIGAEVWVVDTASTNGIFRGDAPVHADVLGDVDVLSLSHSVRLEWRRTEHPEA